MKMNLNNPAFLQAASHVGDAGEYISFVDATGNPKLGELSAIGDVIIQSVYNGVPAIQTITNPNSLHDVQIQSDANTEVVLRGQITILRCDPGPGTFTDFTSINLAHAKSLTRLDCGSNKLTSLDVSSNTALIGLYCAFNQLTSLDVSANTALTTLQCYSNPTLLTIDGIGVNESVASSIASAITDATSVDGTVTLRQGDEFNQIIIDAAMEKGWDVQYYAS